MSAGDFTELCDVCDAAGWRVALAQGRRRPELTVDKDDRGRPVPITDLVIEVHATNGEVISMSAPAECTLDQAAAGMLFRLRQHLRRAGPDG